MNATSSPLEDRLRAHFASRTANEPLPGPDTDDALADVLSPPPGGSGGSVHQLGNGGRPSLWFAAAAGLLAVAATAAVIAVVGDNDPGVSTGSDDTPDPTVTVGPKPTTSTPTTTSTTAAAPPPTKSLVVGFYGPLGGWDGSSWVPTQRWQDLKIGDGAEYQVVRVGEAITTQVGRMDDACEVSSPGPYLDLPWSIDTPALSAIGVTGVANPVPRPVEVIDPSDPMYREAAFEVLGNLDISDSAPEIVEVVRADFDGNGSTEDLVVTERVSRNGDALVHAPGDYSIVFLFGYGVVTSHVVQPGDDFGERYKVDTVADLNGDGRMEVVTHSYYEEGHSQEVNELQADGSFVEVLKDSCAY